MLNHGHASVEVATYEYHYTDGVIGRLLDTHKVNEARKEDIEIFRKHKVWKQVPESKCWRVTGKAPLDHLWIGIDKGDEGQPEYCSKPVANTHQPMQKRQLLCSHASARRK